MHSNVAYINGEIHLVLYVLARDKFWAHANFLFHILLSDHKSPWWQVKLVKCLVQNIVVDISVNQIGGLCTLCFLEKVIFQMLP